MTVDWLPVVLFGWAGPLLAVWLSVAGLAYDRPRWTAAAALFVLPFSLYLTAHPGTRWGITLAVLPLVAAAAFRWRRPTAAWTAVGALAALVAWIAVRMAWSRL
ncbi:MAG: hypothetical protein AB7O67_18965 [Vicinamibacterales bacterium]